MLYHVNKTIKLFYAVKQVVLLVALAQVSNSITVHIFIEAVKCNYCTMYIIHSTRTYEYIEWYIHLRMYKCVMFHCNTIQMMHNFEKKMKHNR